MVLIQTKFGNLCIAGHNYNDSRFFSKIYKLQNNDIIEIYDYFGNKYDYSVYDSYEVTLSDFSCTSQNTYNKKVITLVTCNNLNENRIIVKAIQK